MRNRTKGLILLLLLGAIFSWQGCYTLNGFSIAPEVNTFYVRQFDNKALNAPPTLSQLFTERFKDKIRNQTRLTYNDVNPDIEFSGTITDYRVTSEAPQPNATTAFNRLEIVVSVEFTNNKNEKKNWKSQFSRFTTYASDRDLLSIQDDLIKTINNLLYEDIFRKAFEDW